MVGESAQHAIWLQQNQLGPKAKAKLNSRPPSLFSFWINALFIFLYLLSAHTKEFCKPIDTPVRFISCDCWTDRNICEIYLMIDRLFRCYRIHFRHLWDLSHDVTVTCFPTIISGEIHLMVMFVLIQMWNFLCG